MSFLENLPINLLVLYMNQNEISDISELESLFAVNELTSLSLYLGYKNFF